MQIFNVRLGLATNSSSDHSLMFIPEGVHPIDFMGRHINHFGVEREEQLGDFGWQNFTLVSPEAKLRYLGFLLQDRLARALPPNITELIIKDWLDGTTLGDEDYIDHQSVIYLPLAYGTKIPDERFVRELKDYFLQERLVILGGNDNEAVSHPLAQDTFKLPLPRDCYYQEVWVCRHDDQYNFWTMFNQRDGSKIRFRLTNDPRQMDVIPERASIPELVDLKITNHCNEHCPYCYQNSTSNGANANLYYTRNVIEDLAILRVFEVAIGGGEPILHPEFVGILEHCREMGIVPNFSTRNLHWLRDPAVNHRILEYCGAFAYSARTVAEAHELITLLEYNHVPKEKASLQLVMGVVDMYEFEQILDLAITARLRTTLLGYKSVGRGVDFEPVDYSRWLEVIKSKSFSAGISVDTALAKEFQEQIEALNIPKWLFSVKEGDFSCYIDVVEKKIAPSSFCESEQVKPLECPLPRNDPGYVERVEMIQKTFQEFIL